MKSGVKHFNCVDCQCMSSLFRTLDTEQLARMNALRAEVRFLKGETLIKQHTLATHIYYIKKGLVRNYVEQPERNMVVGLKTGGEFLGLTALSENGYFPYTVSAYEETWVCMFDIKVFKQLALENGAFASEIIRMQSVVASRLHERMICLTQRKLRGRVASLLYCLSRRIYKKPEFETSLTRKDMAEITIMTIESLSRMFSEFKADGIIDVDGNRFKIIDFDKLKLLRDKG